MFKPKIFKLRVKPDTRPKTCERVKNMEHIGDDFRKTESMIPGETVALYLNMPMIYKTECYAVAENNDEMVFVVVVKK